MDRERNVIETVDAINVPWAAEAKHSLDSDDIQADVVRSRRTEVISGHDTRFDPYIYDRFEHERLVRVFWPVVVSEAVLGTVEAGHDRETQPFITGDRLTNLEGLVTRFAAAFRGTTLTHVLDTIVDRAVHMVRADSGSIHVLHDERSGRYLHEACAGRIGSEFLAAFPRAVKR